MDDLSVALNNSGIGGYLIYVHNRIVILGKVLKFQSEPTITSVFTHLCNIIL